MTNGLLTSLTNHRQSSSQAAQNTEPSILYRTYAFYASHFHRDLAQGKPSLSTVIEGHASDMFCQLRDAITSQVQKGSDEVDVLNWMGRTALELIGQGGLGYSLDPLTSDVSDKFADAVKEFV